MDRFISNTVILLTALSFQQTANCYDYEEYYLIDIRGQTQAFTTMKAISVQLTREDSYQENFECVGTYQTVPGRKLMAQFEMIDIKNDRFCDDDYVRLYDGNSTTPSTSFGKFCGKSKKSTIFVTSENSITIQFSSWDRARKYGDKFAGFTIILTDFRQNTCSNDTAYTLQCGNRRCIDDSLKCDGWDNCGDNTDEPSDCLTAGGIAGIAIGSLVILVLIIVLSILGRRRWLAHYYS